MSSKSTHQFPTLSELDPTDLFYVVREESPGVFRDYCAPRSLLPESTLSASVLLTSAQILAIYDTPVEIVQAPSSTSIIVVKLVTMKAVGGTTAYTGDIVVGGSVIDTNNYLIALSLPENDSPDPYRVCYPANAGSAVSQGLRPGEALVVGAQSGNPTTGDGDVLVRVFYQLITA